MGSPRVRDDSDQTTTKSGKEQAGQALSDFGYLPSHNFHVYKMRELPPLLQQGSAKNKRQSQGFSSVYPQMLRDSCCHDHYGEAVSCQEILGSPGKRRQDRKINHDKHQKLAPSLTS